ncbi:MAG: hypothetical protein J6J09_09050 [Phocaeicola sp.]|nr:hypothetical protein [Phocaeicola sp.]
MNTYLLPIIILTSLGIGYKVFKANNDSGKVVLLKFALSLLAFLISCYVLLKIYQVPISYTKVNYAYSSWIPDSNKIDISLIRNYDLLSRNPLGSDGGELIPSNIVITSKNREKKRGNGALIVTGLLKRDSVRISNSSNISEEAAVRLSQFLAEKNTVREFPVDSMNAMAYLSVYGNYRQSFYYTNWIHHPLLDYKKDADVRYVSYDGTKGKGDSARVHKYLNYTITEPVGRNGFKREYFATASQSDTICPIVFFGSSSNYERPNVFTSAEDISKTVEVIELGGSTSRYVRNLTLDYRTPIALPSKFLPEPDEVTMHSIRYTDPAKIEWIGAEGLRTYVSFPNLENVQALRIFVIAGIVGALAALMIRYANNLILRLIRLIRRKVPSKVSTAILIIIAIGLIIAVFLSYKSSNVDVFSINGDEWLYKK